jgi:catechol-2,3-dioxygenase
MRKSLEPTLEPYWLNMLRFYDDTLAAVELTKVAREQITVRREEVVHLLQSPRGRDRFPEAAALIPPAVKEPT